MTYQEINECKSLDNLPNEIFKDIPNYEGLYQVSNLGRVKSLKRKSNNQYCKKDKILKLYIDKYNYFYVILVNNRKSKHFLIHRLVLLVFKGYSDLTGNHKDGNKQNNNIDNLEYLTVKENLLHAFEIGLMKNSLQNNINNRKRIIQYDLKGNFIREYNSIWEAMKITGISQGGISGCINKEKYRKTAGGYIWKKV